MYRYMDMDKVIEEALNMAETKADLRRSVKGEYYGYPDYYTVLQRIGPGQTSGTFEYVIEAGEEPG